jgi:cytochrome c-type biogenesis protein CcmF
MVSRESFLLFNNILLVVAAAVVFGGTLAPLIADTLGLGTLSVGPPYFNPSFLVPMLPLVILVAIGMHARWRRGALGESRRRILGALAGALVLGLAITYGVYGGRHLLTSVGAVVGCWIILSSLIDPINRLRHRTPVPASQIGMTIAHIGLGLFVLGVTFVKTYTSETDVALARGESKQVGDYLFRFNGGETIQGPNFDGFRGHVTASRNGRVVAELNPEKRHYFVQGSVMTEAAINAHWNRDLLVALGEDVGKDAWSLRLQYRPMIRFIWLGAAIMALGGVTTLFDRRYKLAPAASTATSALAGESPPVRS